MAISPKKAKENITEKELKDMETIESHVDRFLMDNYMGYKIEVSLPVRPTPRMAIRLTKMYENAGWKSVSFQGNSATASFSEYEACNAYYDR